MFVRPAKLLVVLLLVTTLGMHWALLQTLAWTTMMAENLQTTSFSEALAKTFDGKHPCCLCKVVKAGENSEQKKEFSVTAFKPEFPPCSETFAFVAPSDYRL